LKQATASNPRAERTSQRRGDRMPLEDAR
jgi:hypothetical protein